MAAAGRVRVVAAFPPPKHALYVGVKLTVVLLIPLLAVSYVIGGKALIPAVMGFLSAAVVPYCTRWQAVWFVLGLAVIGGVSTLAARTWWAVPVVMIACLIAGMASRLSAGVYGVAPIVAAILTLDPPKNPAWVVVLVMIAVGAYVTIVITILKLHVAPTRISWEVAVRHGTVQALACGAATGVALFFDWPKAYWLVMTMAIVLRPYMVDSLKRNRQRVIGTLAGAVIAGLLSPLPRWSQLLLAAVCLTLMFAYLIVKDYVLQVAFMTPMVLFLVSSGTVTDTLNLDGLRVLYTVTGCLIAGMLALLLAKQDQAT